MVVLRFVRNKMGRFVASKQRGFSLVETMIAFAVLAITFLGLAHLMSVGLQQNSRAR